jgi:AcrR family transcriptional regulator
LKKQGLKVSEIAAALGVKHRSVYNYLSRRAAK